MSEFNEGDLVEATKGEELIRARVAVDDEGDLYLPHVGYLTNNYLPGESPIRSEGYVLRLVRPAPMTLPTAPGTVIAIGNWWLVCLRPYETTTVSAWELLPMPTKADTEHAERMGIKTQCVYSADWVLAEAEQEGNFVIISEPEKKS